MLGLILPSVAALLAALALGGSLTRWGETHLVGWHWAVAAFAVELLIYNPPLYYEPWFITWGPWIWVATKVVMIGVAVANARIDARLLSPWTVATLGLLLNTVVIVANGGHMPQDDGARQQVWGASDPFADTRPRLTNVKPLDAETHLPFLADVIPQPEWLPRRNVQSVGDVFLSFGLAWWVFAAVRPRRVSAQLEKAGASEGV